MIADGAALQAKRKGDAKKPRCAPAESEAEAKVAPVVLDSALPSAPADDAIADEEDPGPQQIHDGLLRVRERLLICFARLLAIE